MFFKKLYGIACFVIILLSSSVYAENSATVNSNSILLSSSDQMILRSIERMEAQFNKLEDSFTKVEGRINNRLDTMNSDINNRFDTMKSDINMRFDTVNARFDNLWIAMIGGFIGVMGIIAVLILWDRKTFVKHTKTEILKDLSDDKKKMDAMFEAFKIMGEKIPEIKESMSAHGFA